MFWLKVLKRINLPLCSLIWRPEDSITIFFIILSLYFIFIVNLIAMVYCGISTALFVTMKMIFRERSITLFGYYILQPRKIYTEQKRKFTLVKNIN